MNLNAEEVIRRTANGNNTAAIAACTQWIDDLKELLRDETQKVLDTTDTLKRALNLLHELRRKKQPLTVNGIPFAQMQIVEPNRNQPTKLVMKGDDGEGNEIWYFFPYRGALLDEKDYTPDQLWRMGAEVIA